MGGGLWGRTDDVCAGLSPFAVHLKLSQYYLLISYTRILNKMLKKHMGQIKNRLVVAEGEGNKGGMDWSLGLADVSYHIQMEKQSLTV